MMQYIICMAFLIFFLLYKLNKCETEKERKEYVGQIIHGDWQIDHYHTDYYNFDFFETLQRDLNLANKYRLNKEDKEQVIIIYEEFKKNLSEKYFSNRIVLPKTKFCINNDTFLMYSLFLFLDDKACAASFREKSMRKDTIARENYADGGYNATYSITEFAIVVFKLLYISYMYCKNSTAINPKGDFFNNEKWIEDVIDTQQISIMVYRP